MRNPGFTRFVALDEGNAPDLFRRVTNDELPFPGNGIEERTHVRSRLIAHLGQTVRSLSVRCLDELFKVVPMDRGDVGGLVLATCVPGEGWATAEQIAEEARITGEIRSVDRACTGFPAAVEIAKDIVLTMRKSVAIVTTEILSRMINWEPPEGGFFFNRDDARARGKAAKIFGDKSAAVLLKPLDFAYEFELLDAFAVDKDDPIGCLELTPVEKSRDIDGHERDVVTACINMPGKGGLKLLKQAPEIMAESAQESVQRARDRNLLIESSAITEVVHHQANGEMVQALQGLTKARVWNCIHDMGNVSAASIPSAMAKIQDELPRGSLIAMPAVGAGSPGFRRNWLTRGSVLVQRVR